MGFIDNLLNAVRNKVLNVAGAERDLVSLIKDKDITQAQNLMQNRDEDVLEAIREYNPKLHKIMRKPDKPRKGREPYRTEKLPRARQKYINEVELFFLLGNPVKWKKSNIDGDEDAFKAFNQFLKDTRFDTFMREAKRLAGSETECAKLYHIYRDEKTFQPQAIVKVISKSKGYTLRPLFDQYDNMIAFGYGYYLKEGKNTVEHFDIETPDIIYRCKHGFIGWEVTPIKNHSGKINVIYYNQGKAWGDLNPRAEREEDIDSKVGDTNNYFADPIATATANVVSAMPDTGMAGNLIQLNGPDAKFEYINPPTSSETQQKEKDDLRQSILFDTFTPEFTPEKMVGLGTLSGEAIKRAMVLGYMKRDNNKEIYDIAIDREKNLILAIMMNVTHIGMKDKLAGLQIEHEFAEPFDEDVTAKWSAIGKAYNDGVISLEQAVEMMNVAKNQEKELERIRQAEQSKQASDLFEPTFDFSNSNSRKSGDFPVE